MSQAAIGPNTNSADGSSDDVVRSVIREVSHIATLPEVTLKIIHLVEDSYSTAQDLNKVISNDPALGARILKVVNSAFYGLPGQIGSTNRAIVLLGLNAVKNIAIAASLSKFFRGGQISPSFSARDLWVHCIAVGAGTRMLAAKAGVGVPDEAFLAGLIHDLGIMIEIQARRMQFVNAVERVRNNPDLKLRDAETTAIGANHEQFGSALCKMWKFPQTFVHVTGYHHRPLELPENQRALASLVYVADVIAAKKELGFTRSVEATEADPEVLKLLNLTEKDVEQVATDLPDAMDEAMALLQEG